MAGIAKKGSGQFGTSRVVGGDPNPSDATGVTPGAGGSAASDRLTSKGSGCFDVIRDVKAPPIRKPAQ